MIRIPADIFVIIAALLAGYGATLLEAGAPIRVIVVLAFLLIVPGYAASTAVFPAKASPNQRGYGYPIGPGPVASLDGVERVAVSFGLSLGLLPLFGLLLNVSPWGFSGLSILSLTSGFVIIMTIIGLVRRAGLPSDIVYDIPHRRWGRIIHNGLFRGSFSNRLTNIGLAIAVVLATSTLGFAIVTPQNGNTFTSMTLLTQTEDEDLVASGYPTELSQGEEQFFVLAVENREARTVPYTVIVQLQRIEDGQTVEVANLDRFDRQMPAQGTWHIRHTVTPPMTGENLRLVYLLYEGDPPESPQETNAYRHVSLWIDVSQ